MANQPNEKQEPVDGEEQKQERRDGGDKSQPAPGEDKPQQQQ
jgi:hypothetical protein